MGIEAFGIDPASRFATEHPRLRLKCKPRVKSPAPAGLFFTFPVAENSGPSIGDFSLAPQLSGENKKGIFEGGALRAYPRLKSRLRAKAAARA